MTALINLAYLLGALAFIIGLRRLASPDTARRGNILAFIGMVLAIIAVLFQPMGGSNNYLWIVAGIVIGGVIGWFAAKKIKMTAMPQMVSVFNGLGGACAAVLALWELQSAYTSETAMADGPLAIALFTLLIGGISFTGSMLAYAKLEGLVDDRKWLLPRHQILNMVLLVAVLVIFVFVLFQWPANGNTWAYIFMIAAFVYGVSFVAPIGGADMPVVISLLNSFTGLSAAAAGLIYGNNLMTVGGILVGASGTILTVLMCNAMNRSLFNVIIGGFGATGAAAKGDEGDQVAKPTNHYDSAVQLFYSQQVVFVPGYGLAVAQAQKTVKELDDLLSKNGVEVRYAIHPVAGRMPGHMNVLLAEADVPYPKLLDLEDANATLKDTDVAVVVGANDVVNPSAMDDPSSSIYGMPILDVRNAKAVIVLKRSMRPGYAGIQNPLFFHEKTRMLFGDAKDSIQKVVSEVKNMA